MCACVYVCVCAGGLTDSNPCFLSTLERDTSLLSDTKVCTPETDRDAHVLQQLRVTCGCCVRCKRRRRRETQVTHSFLCRGRFRGPGAQGLCNMYFCMGACVCERETEAETERDSKRETKTERETVRESHCVFR